MLGRNYHFFVSKHTHSFTVYLAMTILFLSSCARYMGYDSEIILKTQEAKEVRTPLGEAQIGIKDIRFYPDGKISAKVESVQTFSVAHVTPKVEKRTAYYADWDPIWDLFMAKAWFWGTFMGGASTIFAPLYPFLGQEGKAFVCSNPVIDLLVRICGGKGRDAWSEDSSAYEFDTVPRYRSKPPGYLSRLYQWTAWINPFYAFGWSTRVETQTSEEESKVIYVPKQSERSLADNPLAPETTVVNQEEAVATPLFCEKVIFEVAGKYYEGISNLSGDWSADVADLLPTLARADTVKVIVIASSKDKQLRAEARAEASELGVTWAVPKVLPGRPPLLDVALALDDSNGNGILEPGESAEAKLTVRNTGDVAAWDLKTNWNTPPSASDVLKVSEATAATYGRLDPGQSWETSVNLQAEPEWTWEGALSINAKVEDASKTAHPEAHTTLATRSFDPPRLELARLKWSDGNDEVLRPGDKVMLRLWVQNTGLSEARGVRVALQSKDENLKLIHTSGDRLQLKPSELRECTWQINIPDTWRPTDDNASGQLPIEYVIREERARYWTMTKPLGLVLGAQSEATGKAQEAVQLAALQEEAKKTIAAEREMKNLQAQLDKRRRDAELRTQKLAEEVKTEELKLADEMDKIRVEAEERKRQFEQEQEELKRKYGEETETYQQEQAKIEALLKKQQESELARLAELERRHKILEEQRKLEQSELYQLRKCSYAVIVGINKYDDPLIGELKYPVIDATALAKALSDPNTGLFAAENVKVLTTDAAEPSLIPTKKNVIEALTDLTTRLGPEDRLLFFFAGHGTTDEQGEGNYLLPQDGTVRSVRYLGLKLKDEILDAFERCQAREQIVIVDACHSGLRKGARDVESRDLQIVANRIENALDAFSKRRSGRAVLMSSSQDQKSQEDDTLAHGVFTHYLVEGLRALATDPTSEVDGDLDGRIEAGELFQFVQERVESWCRQNQRPLQSPNLRLDNAGANIALATQPQEE